MENVAPSGELIGYKAVKLGHNKLGIAKLLIPAEARRVQQFGNPELRADRARVMEIADEYGNMYTAAFSVRDPDTEYIVGKLVVPYHAFDTDPAIKCGSGIHFFLDRLQAAEYW